MKSFFPNLDSAKLKWFGVGALSVALLSFALVSCGRESGA